MRVRFLGYGRDSVGEAQDTRSLQIGQEYVVLGIDISRRDGVKFYVCDRSGDPIWTSGARFDLVSDVVPPNWQIEIGADGAATTIRMQPRAWYEDGFFDDYWSDDPVRNAWARELFRREAEIASTEP
jgi:hypothetical protein